MIRLYVDSDQGAFHFGNVCISWGNQDGDFPGWCVISVNDRNIELGCVDQLKPGIYLTEYVRGDVEERGTVCTFPLRWPWQ